MSRTIQTVTGPITADQLGLCLAHQHILFGYPGWEGCVLDPFDYDKELDHCVKFLNELRERTGLQSIIDATPGDCGRMVDFLRDVSERTGIYIIACSGYYNETTGAPSHFKFRMFIGNPEEEIYQMMKKELTVGVGNTGIKTGLIKVSASTGAITEYDDLFMRAAARLAQELDVSIITHCELGLYYEQARRLIEYGVKPERIMIGHMNDCTQLDDLLKAFDLGVYGAFDRCGGEELWGRPTEDRQLGMILAIASAGYGDKLVLAHDNWIRLLGDPWNSDRTDGSIPAYWNWTHVFEHVIPRLIELGMPEKTAWGMVTTNPANLLR